VEPIGSALIDFAEAAYNLERNEDDWWPALLEAGAPVLDHGLGVLALTCTRPPQSGPLVVDRLHAISGLEDLAERVRRAERETPPEVLFDFNYSISLNSATKTSYRTSYHQLQLNLAYLF